MSRNQQPLGLTPDWKYAKIYHDYWGAAGPGSLRKWSCVHWMMLPHLFSGHWYQGSACRARALWICGTLWWTVIVLPWSSFPRHRCLVSMSTINTPQNTHSLLQLNVFDFTKTFGGKHQILGRIAQGRGSLHHYQGCQLFLAFSGKTGWAGDKL